LRAAASLTPGWSTPSELTGQRSSGKVRKFFRKIIKSKETAMIATLTSKGQITIPKTIRQKLSLHAGGHVSFVVVGDHAELTPVSTPITALKHILPKSSKKLTLEQIDAAIRQGASK